MTIDKMIERQEKAIENHENNNDGSVQWVDDLRYMLTELDNMVALKEENQIQTERGN